MMRMVIIDGQKTVGAKETGDREILMNGAALVDFKGRYFEDANMLDKLVDSFEECSNPYENGYAVQKAGPFTVQQKVDLNEPLSLQEIACRGESGIIIYEDSKEALVVNWSTYGPGELPRLFGTGVIPMAPEEPWHVTGKQRMEDARELLAGVDVIYDANDDLADPEPIPAWVYKIDDGVMIIVPDGWN